MKSLSKLFFIILLLFSTGTSHAQAKKAPPHTAFLKDSIELRIKADFYEKMYVQAKESAAGAHSDLLWSVGIMSSGVLLVIGLLVGVQFYNNIKERKAFEKRIKDSLAEVSNALKIRLDVVEPIINNNSDAIQKLRQIAANQLAHIRSISESTKSFYGTEYYDLDDTLFMIEAITSDKEIPSALMVLLNNNIVKVEEIHQTDAERINNILSNLRQDNMLTMGISMFLSKKKIYVIESGNKNYIENNYRPRY